MSADAVLSRGLLVFAVALTGLGSWSTWRLRELGASRHRTADDDVAVRPAERPTGPPAPDVASVGGGHYEIWTMNGFRIRHAADGVASTQQVFDISRRVTGITRTVAVYFTPCVVAEASAIAGRPLQQDRTFWIRQGGLALFRHVWVQAGPPVTSLVTVTDLSDDVIGAARLEASRPADGLSWRV